MTISQHYIKNVLKYGCSGIQIFYILYTNTDSTGKETRALAKSSSQTDAWELTHVSPIGKY